MPGILGLLLKDYLSDFPVENQKLAKLNSELFSCDMSEDRYCVFNGIVEDLNMRIHNVSVVVIDGLPPAIKNAIPSNAAYARYHSGTKSLNAMYARIYPPDDPRDWWVVVRACRQSYNTGVYLGQPAISIASYRPVHGTSLSVTEFFTILDDGIDDHVENYGEVTDFVLNWAVCLMGTADEMKSCIDIVKTFDFFGAENRPCIVRLASGKEEYLEAAELSKYDPLCAGALSYDRFRRVLRGQGRLVVAYPNRNIKEGRLPIVGYLALFAKKLPDSTFNVSVLSMVVAPQFRRSNIATVLLDKARQLYPCSALQATVPMTNSYQHAFDLFKAYGSTSRPSGPESVADRRITSFDFTVETVDFQLESWTEKSEVGIFGMSKDPP